MRGEGALSLRSYLYLGRLRPYKQTKARTACVRPEPWGRDSLLDLGELNRAVELFVNGVVLLVGHERNHDGDQ